MPVSPVPAFAWVRFLPRRRTGMHKQTHVMVMGRPSAVRYDTQELVSRCDHVFSTQGIQILTLTTPNYARQVFNPL